MVDSLPLYIFTSISLELAILIFSQVLTGKLSKIYSDSRFPFYCSLYLICKVIKYMYYGC